MRICYHAFGDPPLWSGDGNLTAVASLPTEWPDDVAMVLQAKKEREAEARLFLERARRAGSLVRPVFFIAPPSPELALLGDGTVANPGEALSKAKKIAGRGAQLAEGLAAMGPDYRIAGFLHAHETALVPIRDANAEAYYRYPLAEALGTEGADVFSWLSRLADMRLIEPDELMDRLRLCPECQSARLNYLDVCTSCSSLHIFKTSFLHCFTCGHVVEEELFLREGRLICPNCQTRLRQIGVDYDRALESHLCRHCGSRQAEPRVVARCISCGKLTDPDFLAVREVHSYRLASRGENVALLGNVDYLLTSLDILNFTRHDIFVGIVAWLVKLHARYNDLGFGLIGLSPPDMVDLMARVGASQAGAVMETFASKLRDLLRNTDLISRSDRNTLWLVLPKTDAEGCRMVFGRVKGIQDAMTLADGSKLIFNSVLWVAGVDPKASSVEMLFASLNEALDGGSSVAAPEGEGKKSPKP